LELAGGFSVSAANLSAQRAAAMKRLLSLWLTLLFAVALLAPAPAHAAAARDHTPGVEAAETLSQVTGIAISPLLGVGAVGAYKYFKTPAARRASLSWYAQPWFWTPALLLVLACLVKDTAGTVIPTALKKPFDIAEVFENKLSGVVAAGAVIPMVLDMFKRVDAESAAVSLAGAGFGAVDLAPLWGALMVPFALLAYGVVFLVSHTINILILISPFATVDAALKSFRLFLLSTVTLTAFASPTFGAVWSGLIILCCLPLAGWAFRLFVYGEVLAWDLLTFRRRRFTPSPTANWAFLARKLGGVPVRTYGKLTLGEAGNLVFAYRPFLLLPERRITLPAARHAVGRGFLHPELLEVSGDDHEDVLDLPPRYNTHEAAFGEAYRITEVRDVGLRAAWSWFKGLFGGEPAAAAA
jgi:hypothetical protein